MNDVTPLTREMAEVRTAHALRYLGQLCKHFAHKIPVVFDETSGHITFRLGTCALDAQEGMLRLTIEGPAETITELRDVVASHLVRFAFREDLAIDWRPA